MLGAKISDFMLAEKNVVDFVDKNLLQERDRLKQDELETEFVCQHLVGGILDYPPMISHDFCDITTAWDVYLEAFTKATAAKLPKKHGSGIYPKVAEKNQRLQKMPFRGDELTIKQFMNAILLCCPKIKTHLVECTEECMASGRLENIYVIISNVVHIRNYLCTFLELFEYDNKAKVKQEYKSFCELCEVISEQMLQIQANLLTTYVLHDEQSQNWNSYQAYYEGERGSPTVIMWAYFLKSFQRDMWLKMPPQLSQRIFAIIINDSLAILASRYAKIKPSEGTNPQFVCDIVNILATVEQLLFYVCPDVASVCGADQQEERNKVLFSIHLKCHCLASSLLVVGSPLEVLYKTFRRGLSSCTLFESRRKHSTKLLDSGWMSVLSYLCPHFYPSNLEYSDWNLLFSLKLLRAQPSVNWGLVYKILTTGQCKIAKFIVSLFPTVLAPANHFLLEGQAFQRCKLGSCMEQDCHGLPKVIPNHLVTSCVLYILSQATGRHNLVAVYRSILAKIRDWSVMDRNQIWNASSRPVWFQALVDIILPILKCCVQSLCLSIAQEEKEELQKKKTSEAFDLDRITKWVIELLNTLTETLSVIPRGFFMVCEEMDDLIPRKYLPTRLSVPVHFLVTGLYMLLQLGKGVAQSILPSDGKNDLEAGSKATENSSRAASYFEPLFFSIAERLCHLDDPVFDQAVHRLVSQIESMMKQTKPEEESGKVQRDYEYQLETEMANLKADFLLEEVEGQLSLRVVYWFLITHGDVVEDAITGEINGSNRKEEDGKVQKNKGKGKDHGKSGGQSQSQVTANQEEHKKAKSDKKAEEEGTGKILRIAPRIRTSLKSVNIIHDFHYVNRYRTFDEILWNSSSLNWVQAIRHCRMGLRKKVIAKLLERRWEMQPELFAGVSVSTALDIPDEKMRHLFKMVDEIKALIMA